MRGITGLALLAWLVASAGGASAAELRRVEAVGAVPAGADAPRASRSAAPPSRRLSRRR